MLNVLMAYRVNALIAQLQSSARHTDEHWLLPIWLPYVASIYGLMTQCFLQSLMPLQLWPGTKLRAWCAWLAVDIRLLSLMQQEIDGSLDSAGYFRVYNQGNHRPCVCVLYLMGTALPQSRYCYYNMACLDS